MSWARPRRAGPTHSKETTKWQLEIRRTWRCPENTSTVPSGTWHRRLSNFDLDHPIARVYSGPLVRMPVTGGDQPGQTVAHERAPGIGADIEALELLNQAFVREADFGLIALRADFEPDLRPDPFGLVHNEAHVVLDDLPHHLLVRHQLDHPELRIVDVLDSIRELVSGVGVAAFDVFPPPSTNVVDSIEN